MRRALYAVLLAALAYGVTALAQSAPATDTTVIRAGLLVDPEQGSTASNQIIVIQGTKIVAVGGNVSIPSGARVVDLSKSTVLPGLFDSHTHLCLSLNVARDAGNYFLTTLQDPDTYRAVQEWPTRARCSKLASRAFAMSATKATTPAPASAWA